MSAWGATWSGDAARRPHAPGGRCGFRLSCIRPDQQGPSWIGRQGNTRMCGAVQSVGRTSAESRRVVASANPGLGSTLGRFSATACLLGTGPPARGRRHVRFECPVPAVTVRARPDPAVPEALRTQRGPGVVTLSQADDHRVRLRRRPGTPETGWLLPGGHRAELCPQDGCGRRWPARS